MAILVIAAIGAALLLMGGGDEEEQATNYFDKGFKLELYYNQGNSARETACNIMKQNLEAINPSEDKKKAQPRLNSDTGMRIRGKKMRVQGSPPLNSATATRKITRLRPACTRFARKLATGTISRGNTIRFT